MPETVSERPRVGAVIVHFEAPDDLRSSIRSLQLGTQPPDRIVVVDNSQTAAGRRDGKFVAEELGVDYLLSSRNNGFGAGCNAGVAVIDDCEQIFLLNQDAVVGSNVVERLSSLLIEDDRLAAVNPRIDHTDGRVWFASGTFSPRLARLTVPGQGRQPKPALVAEAAPSETEWVNGCAVLIRRVAWADIGGFDDRFFMYWEDIDLSLRLVDRGWRLGVDLHAVAVHDQGDGGTTKLTPTVIEHSVRSRLLFVQLRLGSPDRWTALAYTPVNVLGFVVSSFRSHGLQAAPHLRAVFAGLRPLPADGGG